MKFYKVYCRKSTVGDRLNVERKKVSKGDL